MKIALKLTGITEKSTRYYIVSKLGDAVFYQRSIRDHWRVENKLNWVLYVDFQ